jgi:hypothetical protein
MKISTKNLFAIGMFILMVTISHMVQSQILISLLLGDKLNSPNLEFGVEGGFNRTWLSGIDEANSSGHLHLGLYFDIRIKNDLWLNTGVRVKSNSGAKNINPYSLNDAELDSVFLNGHVERKLGYWYVPVHLKYRFGKNEQFFILGGGQIGLRNKVNDTFYNTYLEKNDVSFRKNIGDHIKSIDLGLSGGLGYKFKGTGMNLGLTYYHGLINIMKETNLVEYDYSSKNSSLYLYVDIPVGAGKKDNKGG